ncbi:hypothetical protein RIF29_00243 [Crotalaria pallida]|uniref:Uncharacterized protein n=1 Tax=Crotalaria pallida TaxID=3830 RepID=A0AAN9IVH1_CROPI
MHGRWEVHKGDTSQLSFIVKKSSMITSKENIDLDVFLPDNTDESFCKVKASRMKKSCEIYTGGWILANAIAFMENKNAMKVEIEANVDHAFTVALLMIVDEKNIKKLKKVGKGIMKATSEAIGAAGMIVGILQLADDN